MPGISTFISAGRRVLGSPSHRRELLAYLRFVAGRGYGQLAAKKVVRTITEGRSGKLLPDFPALPTSRDEDFNPPCDFPLASPEPESGPKEQIELAGTSLRDLSSPWNHTFKDPEQIFAAHRFGWCLPPIAARWPVPSLLRLGDLAVEWSGSHPFGPGNTGWDSYSISERIVNWIYLKARLNAVPTPESAAICSALDKGIEIHAEVLAERLELRGASTNNHLLNNARALYLAGLSLGRERFQEVGREILRYGLRQMFTSSGFLREGSSHYHILLCRSYLEVFWYATKCGDLSFVEELRGRVARQVKCAAFLLDHASLPLIGDVSPDSPPDFHKGVAAVGTQMLQGSEPIPLPESSGWHSLFGFEPGKAGSPKWRESRKIQIFEDAGYYSVDWWPIKLTLYVNPLGYVPGWSHGHADLGGFVLEWDGRPLLVDCGRSTYQANAFGRYGRSVRSHNAISIDRHEPCIVHAHNGFVPPLIADYCGRPPIVRVDDEGDVIRLHLRYFGFMRLQDGLAVSRVFEISRSRVQINDLIEGRGMHSVETFFHLHPTVELVDQNDNSLKLGVGETGVTLSATGDRSPRAQTLRGREGPEPAGWFSPQFGVLLPTVTLRYQQRTMLPVRNSYTMEPS